MKKNIRNRLPQINSRFVGGLIYKHANCRKAVKTRRQESLCHVVQKVTSVVLYNMLTIPVLLYNAEACTLLSTDAAALKVFERKVLRKIFDPVRVGDDFRIRFNSELYELLNDMDIV